MNNMKSFHLGSCVTTWKEHEFCIIYKISYK